MPPRRFNHQGEISLRHLPDTSDTSFSFQIPNALSGNDRLLDEDDLSFLRDTNDDDVNSATPVSDQSNFGPLTMEELAHPYSEANTANHSRHSPKRLSACFGSKAPLKPTLQVPEQAQVTHSGLSNDRMRPNLKLTAQSTQTSADIKSSAISRFEIRAELEVLDNGTPRSPDPPPSTNISESLHQNQSKAPSGGQEWPAMKTERLRTKGVISGGMIKTRSQKAALSGIANNVVSVPAIQKEVPLPPEPQSRVLSDNAEFSLPSESLDLSICSTAPGGVGQNLVIHSQTSTRPATQHASNPSVQAKGDPGLLTQRCNSIAENDHQTGDGRNDPLTLSQISPSKAADSHPIPPAVVTGGLSMRQSTKRPATEPSSPQPVTKKGRSHAIASDDASVIITRALRSAGTRAPAKSSSSGSGSGSRRPRRTIEQTGTRDLHEETTSLRRKPKVKKLILEKPREGVTATLSRSDTTCSSSGVNNPRFSRSDTLATSGTSVQSDGEAGSSRSMGMPPCHERVRLHPANRTKPVGYKFQIDARIEARKAEFENEKLLASQKQRMRNHHQVPDFKTIHAAEEARLGLRKRNMVPTVPLPFELSTDGRAREREKFEEHLREKERESQRVLEEKRREEQELEERAIKELRKKAVPRAHEVPEWYRDVPKRKLRDLDTNRG